VKEEMDCVHVQEEREKGGSREGEKRKEWAAGRETGPRGRKEAAGLGWMGSRFALPFPSLFLF
jgi:hypothetical protein